MIVKAFNPETDHLEKTYLSAYTAKTAVSLPVKNNDRFVATRRIMIGRMGDERTELRTVGTINANKIEMATDATVFDHNADDPIYLLEYDKVRFYRATSSGGSYTLQTTVDIDVDNFDKITAWDDTGSLTTHFYKVAFYNSVTTAESELSDAIQATGYSVLAIGNVVDQVVRRVRDTGYSVLSFKEYIDIANEVGSDLLTQAQRPYTFLKRTVMLSTTLNQNYIDISALVTDFWKYDYVMVAAIAGNTTKYREVTPLSLEAWNARYKYTPQTAQDNIRDVAFDEDTLRLYISPTPKTTLTNQVEFHYYKTFDTLNSSGDLIETPNNLLYRYKLMAEYYSAKSEIDRQWAMLAEKYEGKYGNEIVKLQRTNRLDVGTPRSMRPPRTYRRRRYKL